MSVNNEIMSVNNEIMSNENIVISNSEIIGNSELKNEQVVKKVTKRIRKKKIDENVVIVENAVICENVVICENNNLHEEPGPSETDPSEPEPSKTDPSKPAIVKEEKVHKKRGRKPKGGKIIINNNTQVSDMVHEYNIILHLKCGENDLLNNNFLSLKSTFLNILLNKLDVLPVPFSLCTPNNFFFK